MRLDWISHLDEEAQRALRQLDAILRGETGSEAWPPAGDPEQTRTPAAESEPGAKAAEDLPLLPEQRLEMAWDLVHKEDPAAALTEFEALLETDAAPVEARLGRAVCLHLLGRPEEAATDYRQVLAAEPDNACALENLLLAAGDLAAAQAVIERPDLVSAPALQQAAHILEQAAEHRLAAEAWQAARRWTEAGWCWLQAGERERAWAAWEQGRQEGSPESAWNLAVSLSEVEPQAAAVLWQELAQTGPEADRVQAWFYLGLARLAAGQLQPAREALHQALAFGAPAQHLLGWIALQENDGAKAAEWFSSALQGDLGAQERHSAMAGLALALARLGRRDEASQWIARLQQTESGSDELQLKVAAPNPI